MKGNMKKLIAGVTLGAIVLGATTLVAHPVLAKGFGRHDGYGYHQGSGYHQGAYANKEMTAEQKADFKAYQEKRIQLQKEFLQNEVAAGRISQAQADARISLMQDRVKLMESTDFQALSQWRNDPEAIKQRDALHKKMIDLRKEYINKQVENGQISRERANVILEDLNNDAQFRHGGHRGGGYGGGYGYHRGGGYGGGYCG